MEVVSDENDGGKPAAAAADSSEAAPESILPPRHEDSATGETVMVGDNPSEPPSAGSVVVPDAPSRSRSYGASAGGSGTSESAGGRRERSGGRQATTAEVEDDYDDPSAREPVAHRSFYNAFTDDFDVSDLR